ncbi:MAG: hypothetical protein V3V20_09220 [Algisphaera sp.]
MTSSFCRSHVPHLLAGVALALPATFAQGDIYDHDFQKRVGDRAVFETSGPACEVNGQKVKNENGDAFLDAVKMPDGTVYTEFYRPVVVHDFTYKQGQGKDFMVKGGPLITEGLPGKHVIGHMVKDGSVKKITPADASAFSDLLRDTFANSNLNSLFDIGGANPDFDFIIEFNIALKDNDPEPDDLGELLYFERGRNGGNSWLTIQAVDENGAALGPALAISPYETLKTSPPVMIWAQHDQYVGAVEIDISRLGVSETRFLRVRKTLHSDSGWYDPADKAIDYNPDFKFMAVITHPAHLAYSRAQYD